MTKSSNVMLNALALALPIASFGMKAQPAVAAEGYFCADYNECREMFQNAASTKANRIVGAKTWSVNLPETADKDLQVRFGFFPSSNSGPSKLLIMSSGIHGLEGYTGSAVQNLFLNEILPYANSQNIDVLMINGINAFGMKNHRRHTANRVDLNRNWFASDEFPTTIDDAIYDDFYDIFNPESKATFGELDFVRFITADIAPNLYSVMSGDLTKAARQGQYRFARGMSFGGTKAEPHRKIITDVLDQFVPNYQHVLAMDLHTGLGRRELQLLPNPPYSAHAGELRKAIFEVNGRKIQETGGANFYISHGDFSDFICQYSEKKYQTSTCANMLIEYGTLMPPSWEKQDVTTSLNNYIQSAYTLYVAVRENQAYVHGAASIGELHAIREAWTTMFNPKDSAWRQMILDETRTLFPKYLEKFSEM